jgi:hypothetical protein
MFPVCQAERQRGLTAACWYKSVSACVLILLSSLASYSGNNMNRIKIEFRSKCITNQTEMVNNSKVK